MILSIILLIPSQTANATAESAKGVCLINTVTGEIIFEKNSADKMPMASTTKIMTMLVALKHSKLDDIVTVSKNAAYQEGSSAYLKPSCIITMRDLLYGLMLNSGNDAAVAIAEHISGDVDKFARLMTDTAKEIGADSTQFKNPNGLPDDEHYTTAHDLAVITQCALSLEGCREIVSTQNYTAEIIESNGKITEIPYSNHNRLLRELDGCIGVKTGFTKAAGRCLVSAVNQNGAEYICVTLNDTDDWNSHKALYKYAYNNQTAKSLVNKNECIKHIVSGNKHCELVASEEYSVYINERNPHDFKITVNLPDAIDFPLNKGEKAGYIEITIDGRQLRTIDIIASDDFIPDGKTKVKNCYMFTVMTLLRNLL